jgi:hypothetical protein
VVEGKQAAVRRLDRKGGGAVDISSWRPPVSHDLQPLNQEVIETSMDRRKGIADARGDIPERKKYARGGSVTEDCDGDVRASGGGIHIKPSHRGLLHKDLGVPAGQPIPAAKMEKAKANASPAEKKRITFAENARKWNHG